MPLCACDLTCATMHELLDVRYVHHICKSCVLKFSVQHDTHISRAWLLLACRCRRLECVWVLDAFRVCGCRRLECVWVLDACRVCGCRMLWYVMLEA